jgi:protein-tyrosine phosphatase
MIPLNDGGGNSGEKIEQAIQWILDVWQQKEKVYVCCRHGMNRSVSVSAAALTLGKHCEWLSVALRGIQVLRPIATPRDDTLAEVMMIVCKKKGLIKTNNL